MRTSAKYLGVVSLLAVMVLALGSAVAQAPSPAPVRFALTTWVGWSPLVVAQEKGIFTKHGLKVELRNIDSVADRRSALMAGRIDGFGSTVDVHVVTAASAIPIEVVLAFDDSNGGDGLIAKKGINNLADLKGKTIGLQTAGGASFFWFTYLMEQHNLKMSDFRIQQLSAGDAGAAFLAGKLDAAMTWEPYLTRAKQSPDGHVLMDSSQTPGLIVDAAAFSREFIRANPGSVQAFVNAWFEAVALTNERPGEVLPIIAKYLKSSAADAEAELRTVRIYDKKRNQEYFGKEIYDLSEKAAQIYFRSGLIKEQPDPKGFINARFVQ